MARAVHKAAPPKPRYVPAFTVEKLDGTVFVRKARMLPINNKAGDAIKDKNGNNKYRLQYEEVEEDAGWLVRFPKGHSIHFRKYEDLESNGYTDVEVPLIDMGEGEEVGSVPNQIVRRSKKEVMAHA
jgi:hypothetical protein